MDGQLSFATLDYAGKKKRTKRDVFLAEMAATVPWSVLEAVIAPHYPQQGLRHEGARWRRCQQRARAHRGGDERQRSRCEGDGPFGPRRRHSSLWRQGLRQRYEEARRGGSGGALGGEGESQTRRQVTARQRARNHRFGKVRARV